MAHDFKFDIPDRTYVTILGDEVAIADMPDEVLDAVALSMWRRQAIRDQVLFWNISGEIRARKEIQKLNQEIISIRPEQVENDNE